MSAPRSFVVAGSLLVTVGVATTRAEFAPQQPGSAPLQPALEARVQRLGKQLRCAVCQGLSIADSPASMARAQLDKVRDLVTAGKTDDEIRAYFVERYGEWVLLEPTAQGFNWLVWLGPGAVIVGGLAIIFRLIARNDSRQEPKTRASSVSPSEPEDEYQQKIRLEIDR